MITETCIRCSIQFGLLEDFKKHIAKYHHGFYCPNGHQQWYENGKGKQEFKWPLSSSLKKTKPKLIFRKH